MQIKKILYIKVNMSKSIYQQWLDRSELCSIKVLGKPEMEQKPRDDLRRLTSFYSCDPIRHFASKLYTEMQSDECQISYLSAFLIFQTLTFKSCSRLNVWPQLIVTAWPLPKCSLHTCDTGFCNSIYYSERSHLRLYASRGARSCRHVVAS